MLQVQVLFVGPALEKREMQIPVDLAEKYGEEYLASLPQEQAVTFQKVISFALNQSVIKIMMDEVGPLLNRAAYMVKADVVTELIAQGAEINEKAEFGWTALLAAAAQGYPKIVRLLLDAGAKPDIGNVHGITPLMYGARYGNSDICRILMEYGADLDVQDTTGMSALIVATRDGHKSIVELLLKAGANPNLKTYQGMTALDFAYACKQGKIAKEIKKAIHRAQKDE